MKNSQIIEMTLSDINKMVYEAAKRIIAESANINDEDVRKAKMIAKRLKAQGKEKEEIDNILFSNFNLTLEKIKQYEIDKANEDEEETQEDAPNYSDMANDLLAANGYDSNGSSLDSEEGGEINNTNGGMFTPPVELHDVLASIGITKTDFSSKEEFIMELKNRFSYYRRRPQEEGGPDTEKCELIKRLNAALSA